MDFNTVEVSKFEDKWLKGGNHTVKVTEVKHGNNGKGANYVEITVGQGEGEKVKTASQRYYLNGGAFAISANALFRLIGASNNLDITKPEDEAKIKSMLGSVEGEEQLAAKLSALVVGKDFGIHLDEEVVPAKGEKKAWNKAIFGTGNFAVPVSKMNTLSDKVKVKDKSATGTNVNVTVNTGTNKDW